MSHAGEIVPAWKKYTTAGIPVVAIMTNIMYSIIEKKPIFRWRRGWIGSQGVENLKNLVEDKEIFLADKEVFNTMKTYFLTIKKHLKKKKIVLNYKKICEKVHKKKKKRLLQYEVEFNDEKVLVKSKNYLTQIVTLPKPKIFK